MTLAERLRAAREEQGLTVDDVATLTKLDVVHVRGYEAGWRTPHPKTVARLAAVLSLPVDELLEQRRAEAAKH